MHLLSFMRNMTSGIMKNLPFFIAGPVVKGFGRGSKQLGIPTANFPFSVVEQLPEAIPCGIYFGWASVNSGPLFKMVMSIGWNPYYQNEKKSVEVHILHEFENDFYGALLKVCTAGYIRPEKDFSSLDDLISEIKNDIRVADEMLEKPEFRLLRSHPFWSTSSVLNTDLCKT